MSVLPTLAVMLERFGAPTWLASSWKKKSTSVTQTDGALAAAASAAGGDYIAKTIHCGFAYKNTARRVKRVVLNKTQFPQTYIVTVLIRNKQDWSDEV